MQYFCQCPIQLMSFPHFLSFVMEGQWGFSPLHTFRVDLSLRQSKTSLFIVQKAILKAGRVWLSSCAGLTYMQRASWIVKIYFCSEVRAANTAEQCQMHFLVTKLPALKKDPLSQAAAACLFDSGGSCEHIVQEPVFTSLVPHCHWFFHLTCWRLYSEWW